MHGGDTNDQKNRPSGCQGSIFAATAVLVFVLAGGVCKIVFSAANADDAARRASQWDTLAVRSTEPTFWTSHFERTAAMSKNATPDIQTGLEHPLTDQAQIRTLTWRPTVAPSALSQSPTAAKTEKPTAVVTATPTALPSTTLPVASQSPTAAKTEKPTATPTALPSAAKPVTRSPTRATSLKPTFRQSVAAMSSIAVSHRPTGSPRYFPCVLSVG